MEMADVRPDGVTGRAAVVFFRGNPFKVLIKKGAWDVSLGTLGSFHGMCRAESEYSVDHLMFKQVVQHALTIHREVRGTVEG